MTKTKKIDELKNIEDDFFEKCGLRVLLALRKIIRTIDIHSRKLNHEFKITTPQMICLYSLSKHIKMTQTSLSEEVNLSRSTINGIIDRLESKELIIRTRDKIDRRKVFIEVTEKGIKLTKSAPSLLQDKLAESLKQLPELEQAAIALSLERVVELMDANNIDASPNLILNNQITEEKEIK